MYDLGLFLAGYALSFTTPGPNMVLTASVAMLAGWRGTMALGLGLSAGSAAMALLLMIAGSTLGAATGPNNFGPLVGALAFAFVAWSIAPKARRTTGASSGIGCSANVPGFWFGFTTSVTNPITGTYFASQLLAANCTLSNGGKGACLVAGVFVLCALKTIVVAIAFTTDAARAKAAQHDRAIRSVIASAFGGLAVWSIWPVIIAASSQLVSVEVSLLSAFWPALPSPRFAIALYTAVALFGLFGAGHQEPVRQLQAA